jgi:NADH:ubiquinone oxidoreductase subunit 2 (subunit N)
MIVETIKLNEMGMFPELFLSISIFYTFVYGLFTSINNEYNYPLIQSIMVNLGVLVISFVCFLFINDSLFNLDVISFNNSIANDYLSFASKIVIGFSSIVCLIMMKQYLLDQKINQFEYVLVILFALLGVFLLCSANDLLTTYLAIELQSLAFYILAAFKKNSTYSVDAGLKYFILGAFSSGLFLFGSSLIYGIIGSINFEDFKDLFFWTAPGSSLLLKDFYSIEKLYYPKLVDNKEIDYMLQILADKCANMEDYKTDPSLTLHDSLVIYLEFFRLQQDLYDVLTLSIENVENAKFYLITKLQYLFIIWENLVRISTQIIETKPYGNGMTSYVISDLDFFYNGWSFLLINEQNAMEKSSELGTELFSVVDSPLNDIATLMPAFIQPYSYQDLNYFDKSFDLNLLFFAIIFILISLFFKLALAPFHLWSPDIYEGSPTSSTFFFAVVPKLSIFVLLLRICYYCFYGFIDYWRLTIVIIAILSVFVGSVAGVEQRKLKSLFAFSSISHMGYLLIAFSTGSIEGLQLLFSYLVIYMSSTLCIWSMFVLIRLKNKYIKKQNKDLTDFVLLHKSNRILALILTTALFSIAGLPPMIGFIVKISIFLTAIESSMYFIALFSILFSVISTFYYIRIVKVLYFEPTLVGKLYYPITNQKAIILGLLFYFFIFLFINPTLLYLFSYKIALLF